MKTNPKKQIGLRIRALRRSRGLSQEELAEKAQTSANYLGRMERGTENPTLDMLIKIAASLKVEMWELFDFKHETGPKELRKMLSRFANEISDEKLKPAVKILRALIR